MLNIIFYFIVGLATLILGSISVFLAIPLIVVFTIGFIVIELNNNNKG